MKTILITNKPEIAADCQAAGVARIMVDLESMGKKERQASRNTFISSHSKEDIAPVRSVLDEAELIVRINPWYDGSLAEIGYAIKAGADFIMLPMITDMQQVHACADAMGGREKFLPLVETAYSMEHIKDIAAMDVVPELYIGLNDLHLSLQMDFLFEPLATGHLDDMAKVLHAQGKPFGFGGIAKMGQGELPAERILGEHQRLGSTRVILSSRFGLDVDIEEKSGRIDRLRQALAMMNDAYERLSKRTPEQREQDSQETFSIIANIANTLKQKRHTV